MSNSLDVYYPHFAVESKGKQASNPTGVEKNDLGDQIVSVK